VPAVTHWRSAATPDDIELDQTTQPSRNPIRVLNIVARKQKIATLQNDSLGVPFAPDRRQKGDGPV